jgi:hypothetical protein
MADLVATEASVSDNELFQNIKELVASLESENDRREVIAVNVLLAYAKGSLTHSDASDIVVSLILKTSVNVLIDRSWERGQFKELGQQRRPHLFLRWGWHALTRSTPVLEEAGVLLASNRARVGQPDGTLYALHFLWVTADGHCRSTPTASQADSRAECWYVWCNLLPRFHFCILSHGVSRNPRRLRKARSLPEQLLG